MLLSTSTPSIPHQKVVSRAGRVASMTRYPTESSIEVASLRLGVPCSWIVGGASGRLKKVISIRYHFSFEEQDMTTESPIPAEPVGHQGARVDITQRPAFAITGWLGLAVAGGCIWWAVVAAHHHN